MKIIDDFLNSITMYRLVLYYLIVLLGWAGVLSLLGLTSFSFFALAFLVSFILVVCWTTNKVFARVFQAPTNLESVYITALILSLIITPTLNFHNLPFIFLAGVCASASKFILAISKKHVFNPAAIGVIIAGLLVSGSASWWVGTLYLLPVTLLGGFLVVRKIKAWSLVLSFLSTALLTIFIATFLSGNFSLELVLKIFTESPLVFFATIMLVEPLTSPTMRKWKMVYGALVGLLFSPQIHFGLFYFTPELALISGNVFSYLVSPKYKLALKLIKRNNIAPPDIDELTFSPPEKITFKAGQYLEWTLAHKNTDSRGSRRYFTIASSPSEEDIKIGVKFFDKSSSFKTALGRLKIGDPIIAGQLSGEFTLPEDASKKLVFIAGGIGVTPFRSMVKYLVDKGEKRDIVLFYSNKTESEIVYKDIFDSAKTIGVKTIYINTEKQGYLDQKKIQENVPDFKERYFYLSGPHSMVDAFEKTLNQMGVPKSQIKTDYFPGYA